MKKITFTVQVFGLMAMVPILVILEMSHGTGSLPGNNNHPIVKEKVEKTITPESSKFRGPKQSFKSGKILRG